MKTYIYLKSILGLLGSVVALVYVITKLSQEVDSYPKMKGEVTFASLGVTGAFTIYINGNSQKYAYVFSAQYIPILIEKDIVGKDAEIWVDETREAMQLIVDNELVIPFKKRDVFYWFLIIMVLSIDAAHIIYIIHYRKNKSNPNNFHS